MKGIKRRAKAVYHLIKLEDHLDFLIGAIAVAIIANGSLLLPDIGRLIYALLFGLFLLGGTIVLNQYFDIEVDRINKPHRPLPSGAIKPRSALIIVGLCYLTALFLSFFLGQLYSLIAIIAIFLSFTYSHPYTQIRKRSILLQVFIINAGYSVITFLIGWCVYKPVELIPLWFIVFLFITDVGGVIVKDYRDYEGDKKHGYITLPTLLGYEKAVLLNSVIYITPFICLLALSILNIVDIRFAFLSLYCILTGSYVFLNMKKGDKKKEIFGYYLITANFMIVRIFSVWALVI